MARTVTANSGPFFLSSANPGDSPLTIAAGVTLSGAYYGIEGDGTQAWVVVNQGTVVGTAGNAIYFGDGGTITNSGTASSIHGGIAGIFITKSAGTVSNEGTVSGTNGGVMLEGGGIVTNSGIAASIQGVSNGVYFAPHTAAGTVTNEGGISAASGKALNLQSGGTVANNGTSAGISASSVGVYFGSSGGAGSVTNQGTISGGFAAVFALAGGRVSNSGTAAVLIGNAYGVYAKNAAVVVTNEGTISATTNRGVVLAAGGSVINSGSGALISGAVYGINTRGTAASTVSNQGTITGGSGAVQFAAVDGNVFRTYPGAASPGGVFGGGGVDTLALGSSVSAGTMSGIGSQYTGFSVFDVDAGADWVLAGANTLGAAASLAVAAGGSLEFAGPLSVGAALNQGTITAASGNALYFGAGGTVTNSGASALISGADYAIFANNAPVTIFNQGSMTGSSLGGVSLYDGGLVTNSGTAARISGGHYGVFAKGSAATVINQGTLAGSLSIGVYLGFGGNVTNSGSSAVISGAGFGILAGGVGGVVTNQGTISASDTSGVGVNLLTGFTVTNAGTIIGAADAVRFSAGHDNRLVVDPGAVFAGKVDGGNTIGATAASVLELASGASSGTLAGLGSQYVNFANIDVDAGAKWVLAGANTVRASASIDVVGGASLEVAGTLLAGATLTLGGTGNLLVDPGGAVEVGNSADAIAGQVVVDADSTLFYAGYVSLGTVLNQGSILGSYHSGVYLRNGGIVTNSGTAAIISGPNYGVFAGGSTPTTVINQGTVAGTASIGVYLRVGGVVTNSDPSAVIAGGILAGGAGGVVTNQGTISASGTTGVGVNLLGGGTLTNAGTIIGAADAVRFSAGHAGLLVVDPGAVFAGKVDGGNPIGGSAVSILELTSGSGTFGNGATAAMTNFGTIEFDAGAQWKIADFPTALTTGEVISGFQPGDTIELIGVNETIAGFAGGTLSLSGSQALHMLLPDASGTFLATPNAGNTDITLACFAAGTRIRTPRGEIAVEALAVGDTVLVLNEREAVPIVWIGQRVVNCARHLRPEQVWPVRIRAGAFGSARPCRDLLLSPDHAVYVDVDTEDGAPGVLIPVRLLINGGSIAQVKMDQVTYYHVELPRHDVVLAEGLPAESYLDTGNRGNFANAGGAVALHPDFASLTWDAAGCAPLVVTGPRLEAVRRRLAERADGNMPGAAPGRDGMDHDPQRRKARLSRRAGSGVRESRRG